MTKPIHIQQAETEVVDAAKEWFSACDLYEEWRWSWADTPQGRALEILYGATKYLISPDLTGESTKSVDLGDSPPIAPSEADAASISDPDGDVVASEFRGDSAASAPSTKLKVGDAVRINGRLSALKGTTGIIQAPDTNFNYDWLVDVGVHRGKLYLFDNELERVEKEPMASYAPEENTPTEPKRSYFYIVLGRQTNPSVGTTFDLKDEMSLIEASEALADLEYCINAVRRLV